MPRRSATSRRSQGRGYGFASVPRRQFYGLSSFSTSNYYQGVAGEGPLATNDTTRIVVYRYDTLAGNTTTRTMIGAGVGTARAWRLDANNTTSNVGATVAGGTTIRTTFVRAMVAGDQGKCFSMAGTATTGGATEAVLSGVSQNTGSGGAFVDGNSSDRICVGARFNGASPTNPADNVTILGWAAVSSVLTAAQILAWHDAIVAANGMVDSPTGTTTHLFDAADAGATWTCRKSGQVLTMVGTVTKAVVTPSWGTP